MDVRSAGGGLDLGADLAAAAVAAIHPALGLEFGDAFPVEVEPPALAHDVAVPVESDRRQVGQLPPLVLG